MKSVQINDIIAKSEVIRMKITLKDGSVKEYETVPLSSGTNMVLYLLPPAWSIPIHLSVAPVIEYLKVTVSPTATDERFEEMEIFWGTVSITLM